MNQARIDFHDSHFDGFFERWVAGKLSVHELQEWSRLMMQDTKLRENFADWVRSLRDEENEGATQ